MDNKAITILKKPSTIGLIVGAVIGFEFIRKEKKKEKVSSKDQILSIVVSGAVGYLIGSLIEDWNKSQKK